MLVGNGPQGGAKSSKGENFLDTLNPTSPQSKLPSPIPFHHGWAMGRGGGVEQEGGNVIHWCFKVWDCPDLLKLIPQLHPGFMLAGKLIPVILITLTTHLIVLVAILTANQ